MTQKIALTVEEIRTLNMFTSQYQTAQARAQVASELNFEYQALLREKYNLDETWVCNDILEGFVCTKAGDNAENN